LNEYIAVSIFKFDQPRILSSPAYTRMPLCQALIQNGQQKGQPCTNETDGTYCAKHKRQAIVDKATKENTRLCDIARGCYTVLEDHQAKCTHCLHKARISERKRNDQKRQDPTLCLDCGTKLTEQTTAKGKYDKLLRRCVPCYAKLQKVESQRPLRERNYKAEAFTNKHVLWNHYVKSAQKRRIDFAISKAVFQELIVKPCFYCSYHKEGLVNGLDRLNNNAGYVEDNVVSCCELCNNLKASQHPQEFIDKMQAIHNYRTSNTPIEKERIEKWNTTYSSKSDPLYKSYAKSANSRNIKFSLSEAEFANIIKQSCYLCGLTVSETNKNGIDRFNNSAGYELENCRACCGHCNLLKRDMSYADLTDKATRIAQSYSSLTESISKKSIPVRLSKTEARAKVETPLSPERELIELKPLNEIIIPREPVPEYIQELLKKPAIIPKQWKSKQIYRCIQEGKESQYKLFCEDHNTIQENWNEIWSTFITGVQGKSFEHSEPIIRAFVENLRRLRHNELQQQSNNILEKEDRLIWPSTTVARAFLEGKLDAFKAYTETHTNESPNNPKWIKRWTDFVESLNTHRTDEAKLKELASKFMTAQRIKKYRNRRCAPESNENQQKQEIQENETQETQEKQKKQ